MRDHGEDRQGSLRTDLGIGCSERKLQYQIMGHGSERYRESKGTEK